ARKTIVRTNHQVLTQLKAVKEIGGSVACCYDGLERYEFTPQHGNADALSCRPIPMEVDSVVVGALFLRKPTQRHRRNMQCTEPNTALLYERFMTYTYSGRDGLVQQCDQTNMAKTMKTLSSE
ncbi:hypothetical protein TSMEX_003518, partial [Taenia solium]